MTQKLYKNRYPIAILMASLLHGAVIFLVGNEWQRNVVAAEVTSAPMVIKLAPLAYNNAPVNDISPVMEQQEIQKKPVEKKYGKQKKILDVPEGFKPNVLEVTEAKKVNAEIAEILDDSASEQEIEKNIIKESDKEQVASVLEITGQLIETENQQEENSALIKGHQSRLQHQIEISWQNKVMQHLSQKKRYPRTARKRKQEGTVFVRFDVDKVGNVNNIEVIKKSKFGLLNKEAIAVLERSAPLPLPPTDFLASQKKIVIPIKFYLL